MKTRLQIPIELIFWITALVVLAGAKFPEQQTAAHFTFCPLANLGFDWCPGCGIGRSITALFQGNLGLSFQLHWFGLPALMILLYRISILIRLQFSRSRKNNLERKEKSYV
jgi:hypothetical protein